MNYPIDVTQEYVFVETYNPEGIQDKKPKKSPLLTLGKIRDYILKHYHSLLWWDGYHKHEPFNPTRSYKHRACMPNEIRIEFDLEDRNKTFELVNESCLNLDSLGYSYAVFYVVGGRSPHIHIYDLDEMDTLNQEQREEYRRKFLTKVCPKGSNPDYALCDEKHLMALEFANHFKYKKPKELLNYFWNGKNQGIDFDIKIDLIFGYKPKIKEDLNKNQKLNFAGNNTAQKVMSVLTFEKVFSHYGVKYKGRLALCPFHNDSNFSLSFSNDKKLWKCFGSGCEKKGDLISLIRFLEAVI